MYINLLIFINYKNNMMYLNVLLVDDTISNLIALQNIFKNLQKEYKMNILTQDDGDKSV